jgi:rhodanese-related sulfurtransferase
MAQIPTLHMKALKDKYRSLNHHELILDVRTPEEYAEGHIPGARNITHEEVENYLQELNRYQTVYVHCRSGKRAQTAVDTLSKRGLCNLILIKDSGMIDWIELNYPIEKS